jgi:hypothetical protein
LQPVYNEAAPDTPMFVLHLYDREWRNRAALRAVGYTKKTPDPPGAFIERDRNGYPTALLVSKPNSLILYSTLAKGPKLSLEDQVNSSRLFFREQAFDDARTRRDGIEIRAVIRPREPRSGRPRRG